MPQTKQIKMPVPTFSWLGVSGAEYEVQAQNTDSLAIQGGTDSVQRLNLQKSTDIQIKGASAPQAVIMQISGEQNYIRTSIQVGYGEKIKLVQVITGAENVADIQAELDDCAELELIQLYLETGHTAGDILVHMNGRKSVFTSNIGYYLAGGNALDINLNIIQNGKKSESATTVKGVLREDARKIFRGTIDFQNGAAGAIGTEQENVLLLGEKAVNQTVPVILCAEEDVVGSHGATIGQIDPRHIFYMQSRGIPEAQIYEMVARSQLGSIIRQAGDPETEAAVFRLLGTEEEDAVIQA